MFSPDLITLYAAMAYSQHTGKRPENTSDIAEWLNTHDLHSHPISTYNQAAHDYIISLIDEAHNEHGADRTVVARSLGILLGLHTGGMSWTESQNEAEAYLRQQAGEVVRG